MISGVGVDRIYCLHSHNNSNIDIYVGGLHLPREEGSTDPRNTENEHITLHLRNNTENLSLVSIHRSPMLSVIS